jgi:hypothetical protein
MASLAAVACSVSDSPVGPKSRGSLFTSQNKLSESSPSFPKGEIWKFG